MTTQPPGYSDTKEAHLNHCVTHAIQAGGAEADAKVKEASAAIARLVRS